MGLEEDLKLASLFPTYAVRRQWHTESAFRENLKACIYDANEAWSSGQLRSNSPDTWHSDDHLLSWADRPVESGMFTPALKDADGPGPLARMFCDTFSAVADLYNTNPGGEYEMKIVAWAMVYRDGGYSRVHNHAGAHFSGVYYVDVGKPSKPLAGDLEFVDTRSNWELAISGMTPEKPLSITPRTDEMIAFPAWLPHFVHPYVGEGPRIAISANAHVVKYTPPGRDEED